MRSASPLLVPGALLACALAAPAAGEEPAAPPPLPRVIYGTPEPSVIYGPPSSEPERRREAPPPAPAESGTRLEYQTGPAYYPPALWFPPPYWRPPPHRHRPPLQPQPPPWDRRGEREPREPLREPREGRLPTPGLEPRTGYQRPPR